MSCLKELQFVFKLFLMKNDSIYYTEVDFRVAKCRKTSND